MPIITLRSGVMSRDAIAPETMSYAPEIESPSMRVIDGPGGSDVWVPANRVADKSLSAHMRRLRRRNHGISRWLALAVLIGAIVALAFVDFLAR
jgi:hypothetical protein